MILEMYNLLLGGWVTLLPQGPILYCILGKFPCQAQNRNLETYSGSFWIMHFVAPNLIIIQIRQLFPDFNSTFTLYIANA
jgi:hypothetical protein